MVFSFFIHVYKKNNQSRFTTRLITHKQINEKYLLPLLIEFLVFIFDCGTIDRLAFIKTCHYGKSECLEWSAVAEWEATAFTA